MRTPVQQTLGAAARALLPALFVSPLAAVVAWRTWAHARRYVMGASRLEGRARWQRRRHAHSGRAAVASGLIPLLPFAPATIGRSHVAVVLFASLATGFVAGAACAVVLREIGIATLRAAQSLDRFSVGQ
jgi:hypothetical protein